MNLKRIIIDTDNGERFIYEDFTSETYVELGQEGTPVYAAEDDFSRATLFPIVGDHSLYMRLRARTVTVTEALPGNTDYDWLLERYKLLRKDLDQAKAMYQEFVDGVAAALGFDEERADLKQQIKDLNRENRTLQDIIDSHWDGDW